MIHKSSGHSQRKLRKLLPASLIPFAAALDEGDGDGGESGDGDGDGSEGSSGADSGDGDGDGSEEGSGDGDIADPEKKRLSDEAKKHRLEKKAEKERADKLQAELQELKDKDLGDLDKANAQVERLSGELSEANDTIASLRDENQTLRLDSSFTMSGAANLFTNSRQALTLMKAEGVLPEPDDEGNFDDSAVKKAAETWLKKNKHLGRADGDDGGSGKKGSGGSPSNGSGKPGDKKSKKDLTKKFPALAGRVSNRD